MSDTSAANRQNVAVNQRKLARLWHELLQQIACGEPINITEAATKAGCRRGLYYRHPELQAEIHEAADAAADRRHLGIGRSQEQTNESLKTQLAQLEGQIDARNVDIKQLLKRLAEHESLDNIGYSSARLQMIMADDNEEVCLSCATLSEALSTSEAGLADAEKELSVALSKLFQLEADL